MAGVKVEENHTAMVEETPTRGVATEASDAGSNEAADYGIKRVTIEQFEFGGYRYTNLKDAVAEARRHREKAGAP
jgi:hypothetical protein